MSLSVTCSQVGKCVGLDNTPEGRASTMATTTISTKCVFRN